MEMFDEMSAHGLSPNQYYLLCCMRDSMSPLKINLHLEHRALLANKWITENNKLTPKAVTLVDKLERLFSLKKAMTSNQLLGQGFKENIIKYVEMFPNIKLDSGKAARSAYGNLEKNFRWFFENHSYSWELIFRATAKYVNEKQKVNWKFMRTSQYFIRKNQLSDLADYCEMIRTGGDQEPETRHTIKVV